MRRAANLREKLAAMIVAHFQIERDHAKAMSVEQILSLIEVDHDPVHFAIARDLGWTAEEVHHPSNLTVRLISGHREKTRQDIRVVRKVDRVSRAHQEFRSRMLASEPREESERPKMKTRWPKRPFAGRKPNAQS